MSVEQQVQLDPTQIKTMMQQCVLFAMTGTKDQRKEALVHLRTALKAKSFAVAFGVLAGGVRSQMSVEQYHDMVEVYAEIIKELEKEERDQTPDKLIRLFFTAEDDAAKKKHWDNLVARGYDVYLRSGGSDNREGFCYDTLIALVEKGPVWDGNIPSKAGRDQLIDLGMAVRVIFKGEDGFTAATYLGSQLYKYCHGNASTIEEAKATRLAEWALMKARQDSRP